MRLRDNVALITGAASGMAAAQARLFASEGAAVCVADINEVGGRQVASEIIDAGGKAIFASLDVTDSSQWAEAVSATERELGSLTVLRNNAGANFRVSFDDQTEEMWHTVMNIGLTGAFLGIKAAVPAMRRAGGGAIVNMGSLASTRSGGGSPAYGASKAGMVGLTNRRPSPTRLTESAATWFPPATSILRSSARTTPTAPTTGQPQSTTPTTTNAGSTPRRWAASKLPRTSPRLSCSWPRTTPR